MNTFSHILEISKSNHPIDGYFNGSYIEPPLTTKQYASYFIQSAAIHELWEAKIISVAYSRWEQEMVDELRDWPIATKSIINFISKNSLTKSIDILHEIILTIAGTNVDEGFDLDNELASIFDNSSMKDCIGRVLDLLGTHGDNCMPMPEHNVNSHE